MSLGNHVPCVHETFATTTCLDILTGRCLHSLLTVLCPRWRKSGVTLHIGDEEVDAKIDTKDEV